ncbi:hypothetical protein [Psychromonas sp. Urea-02u-13]|uniref:hypothetical protein n=1 Tax=Psychromonas sp. Urea-02u-13 TaxID=2058326 RepID=UPI000C32BACD|nr:hypothetical protein [Psychromonas sp. Urea-02u-13]PKG37842.1 hypothetical protein CXF74_16590 [Psychromonas sp. Urea-02u-13]
MPIQLCEICGEETAHKEAIVQKPSKYGKSKKEQFKAFLSGFFLSDASVSDLSHALTDRYVICEKCGHKKLENIRE